MRAIIHEQTFRKNASSSFLSVKSNATRQEYSLKFFHKCTRPAFKPEKVFKEASLWNIYKNIKNFPCRCTTVTHCPVYCRYNACIQSQTVVNDHRYSWSLIQITAATIYHQSYDRGPNGLFPSRFWMHVVCGLIAKFNHGSVNDFCLMQIRKRKNKTKP